ncbi:Phosphoribosyl-ATP pyrophosphatase [Candidatus Hodgkinia cicadicola]|nr:Phosphoribosyl-ATP pyrophosphatase [Candidatus Hodgkinia cicadicola]
MNKINITDRQSLTRASIKREYAIASFTDSEDNYKKEMILDSKNAELKAIDSIVRSAVVNKFTIKRSWTSKMLHGGLCSILKKVNEETAELVIAVCAQTDKHAIMESADLIYHIILLLRPLNISFESLMSILAKQAGLETKVYSLGALKGLAVYHYNRAVEAHNRQLSEGFKVESVVSTIVYKLYTNLSRLTFLSVRTGVSTFVSALEIKNAIYNMLFSILLILYYKNVNYQCVVDELYKRVNVRKDDTLSVTK